MIYSRTEVSNRDGENDVVEPEERETVCCRQLFTLKSSVSVLSCKIPPMIQINYLSSRIYQILILSQERGVFLFFFLSSLLPFFFLIVFHHSIVSSGILAFPLFKGIIPHLPLLLPPFLSASTRDWLDQLFCSNLSCMCFFLFLLFLSPLFLCCLPLVGQFDAVSVRCDGSVHAASTPRLFYLPLPQTHTYTP